MTAWHLFKLLCKYICKIASAIGITWTIIDLVNNLCDTPLNVDEEKKIILAVALVSAILILLYYVFKSMFFTCKLEKRDIEIRVRVGNILRKRKGTIVVGINKALSTNPDKIGKGSIHEQLLIKYPDNELINAFAEEERKLIEEGKNASMGYFFKWSKGKQDFLFLVMSDLEHSQAPSTQREDIQLALQLLFNNQKKLPILNGHLYLPLLGTGASAVRMPRTSVMELIINEYIVARARSDNQNPNRIKTLEIVIFWKDLFRGNVLSDWGTFRENVMSMVRACDSCPQIDNIKIDKNG